MISSSYFTLTLLFLILFSLPRTIISASASILKINLEAQTTKMSPFFDPKKLSLTHNTWIGEQSPVRTPTPSPVSVSNSFISPNPNPNPNIKQLPKRASSSPSLRRSIMNDLYFDPTVTTSQLTYNELVKAIDNTPPTIIHRFLIYIDAKDSSAIFSELRGNKPARSLQIYEGIEAAIIAIAECSLNENSECYKSFQSDRNTSSAYFVASVLAAFIHFKVDITKTPDFFKNVHTFNVCFMNFERPFFAFYILTRNKDQIIGRARSKNINFYAVESAIALISDDEIQLDTVMILIKRCPGFNEQTRLHCKLLKRSSNIALCELIARSFPQIVSNTSILHSCHLKKHPKKFDFFYSVFGFEAVRDVLESDFHIKPQMVNKNNFKLPFLACPLSSSDHPRWSVYSQAFGPDLIDTAKYLIYNPPPQRNHQKRQQNPSNFNS